MYTLVSQQSLSSLGLPALLPPHLRVLFSHMVPGMGLKKGLLSEWMNEQCAWSRESTVKRVWKCGWREFLGPVMPCKGIWSTSKSSHHPFWVEGSLRFKVIPVYRWYTIWQADLAVGHPGALRLSGSMQVSESTEEGPWEGARGGGRSPGLPYWGIFDYR